MRLALQGAHDAAFEKLTEEQAHYFQAEQGAAHDRYTTPFVSRTHGTFSGCEPYTMSISLEEGLPIEEVYAADEDMFMMSPFIMGWIHDKGEELDAEFCYEEMIPPLQETYETLALDYATALANGDLVEGTQEAQQMRKSLQRC